MSTALIEFAGHIAFVLALVMLGCIFLLDDKRGPLAISLMLVAGILVWSTTYKDGSGVTMSRKAIVLATGL